MYDEIKDLFINLGESKKRNFYGLKGIVDDIINNKEENVNKIERILDELLDDSMNLKEAEDYYFKLCYYLGTFERKVAEDYLQIFKEIYDEDYNELSLYKDDIEKLESIKHYTDDDEFWYARELMVFLGYSNWNKFKKIIKKAKSMFSHVDCESDSHFYEIKTEKIDNPVVEQENYQLFRTACYLIIQYCKSTEEIVLNLKYYLTLSTIMNEKKQM